MFKKTISITLIVFLLTVIASNAWAYEYEGIIPYLKSRRVISYTFDAWNQYKDVLFTYDNVDPDKLSFGYYNFDTGEEYYHNGNKYFIAASMYKVPLCMLFAEKIADGELTPNTEIAGYTLEELIRSSIVDSSNSAPEILWNSIGGYQEYKRQSAKYLCDNPDNMPWEYYENNNFTSEQLIYCLKLLVNEPERFPGIVDYMLLSGEGAHFKRDVSWCPIASKMGFVVDEGYHTVYTDMGIVYTTETFAIVMFTDNLDCGIDALADYCSLMCDYTNSRHYDAEDRMCIHQIIMEEFNIP